MGADTVTENFKLHLSVSQCYICSQLYAAGCPCYLVTYSLTNFALYNSTAAEWTPCF